MKSFLAVFLSVALLAMTADGLAWTFQAKDACAESAESCCDNSPDKSHEAPSSAPSCVQCCLVCCAVLPPAIDDVGRPAIRATKWERMDFGSDARRDEPPVPPPRLG